MAGLVPELRKDVETGRQAFSVRELVFTLFRRRWIILAIALPIIAVGGTSLFQQTGAYTAATRVVVELIKVDLPQWNTSGRNLDYDRELSTLFNIAMSVPVAESAAASLKDSIPTIRALNPNLIGLENEKDLAGFLVGGLDVSVVGESSILEFRFSSAHPRISLMCVGALRTAFIEYEVHGRKNLSAIAYYEEQVGSVRASIDSLLTVRADVMEESGFSSMEDELRNEVGQLADLENQLYKATANRHVLEARYERLAGYLDGDPRDFPMGEDESRAHALIYWRNLVSKHEDELNSILSVHTEESVPARRHRRLLDGSLERLRQQEEAYVESIRTELTITQARENVLRQQIAEVTDRNARAPLAYQRVSLIDVEIQSMRRLLENLQGKWGEVRINQLADERVSSVVVLNEPEVVMVLSGSKTIVYFILVIFFALALGIVAAIVVDSLDHRVYVPQDVEEHLQLPVFASVTKAD